MNDAKINLREIDPGMEDGSAVSQLEEERHRVISELTSIAEKYVDLLVQAKLLRWSIDRYQEENRSPFLTAASEKFKKLTLGEFSVLDIDTIEDPPQLFARRNSNERVDLDGLSDGTADQLYLALRLTAAEATIEKGASLPIVADDLFVNFDDHRSAAGFELLAEIARSTQVIYLTHHPHLVDVIKSAINEPVNVITL